MRSAEERRARSAGRKADRLATRDRRLDAIAASGEGRKAAAVQARAERTAAVAAQPVIRPASRFEALGVQIMDNGDVHTFNGFGGTGRRLGPAAGATAEVGAERRRHRVAGAAASTLALGPLGLVGAVGKKAKASAFITLADGTFHEHKLDGNAAVTRGHRQAAAFNAAVTGLG